MKTAIAVLLGCTALAAPAYAADASPADPSIEVVPYTPLKRVVVVGALDRATNFTVSPKEQIIRLTFGQEGLWDGPNPDDLKAHGLKNNVALWPRKPGRTNLIMLTQDDKGDEHPYYFTLVVNQVRPMDVATVGALPTMPDGAGNAVEGVVMAYPDRERADRTAQGRERYQAQAAAWQARRAKAAEAAARAKLAQDQAAAPCNPHYTGQGDRVIAPVSVCDNGQATFFRYPGNMRPPSLFSLAPDGSEQWVPAHMAADGTIVADTVADEFHLRLGRSVLYVFNRAYNPVGVNPGTGTSSPDVMRTVRQAVAP